MLSDKEREKLEREFQYALDNIVSKIKGETATAIVCSEQSMILLFEKLMLKIEKQSKEIEELKKQLDLDNECEIALNNKIMDLEKEIEELKDKCKELIFEKQELTSALLDSTPNDKIKAKIEPVLKQFERKMEEEYNKYGNSREYQDVVDAYNFLQSLLEKE